MTPQYEGMTALHWAVESGAIGAALTLLAAGADPSVLSNSKHTPLDILAELKPKQRAAMRTIAEELVARGGRGAIWTATGGLTGDGLAPDVGEDHGDAAAAAAAGGLE